MGGKRRRRGELSGITVMSPDPEVKFRPRTIDPTGVVFTSSKIRIPETRGVNPNNVPSKAAFVSESRRLSHKPPEGD